jgi:hypothetical protein
MTNGPTRNRQLTIAIFCGIGFGQAACGAEAPAGNSPAAVVRAVAPKEQAVQIRINAGDTVLTARLEDSAAAREFEAMLPLRLTLKDYASTEKIADLPRKLSTDGAPAGIDPGAGDITFYAPWGNLAIFYREGRYSPGLVRLGRLELGAEQLASLEGPVTIEAVAP